MWTKSGAERKVGFGLLTLAGDGAAHGMPSLIRALASG
jgi:hypothetical protein